MTLSFKFQFAKCFTKAFMAPFTRASPKKRRIAAQSSATKRPVQGTSASAQVSDSHQHTATSTASDDPNLPEPELDDLDVVLDLPEDLDEGMELHDNGAVQQAVVVALDEMKRRYGVVVPPEDLRDARDVLTKV